MAALAFIAWGAMPLYYQFLPHAQMDELLSFRIVGSLPFLLFILWRRKGPSFNIKAVFSDKKSLPFSALASIMMCISWAAFTWAMTNDRVLDASLGFFINPLLAIGLGVFVFKETLSLGQKAAVFFGGCGLFYQIWQYAEVPLAAVIMAVFFTLYGWCKRHVQYDTITSLFVEIALLSPIALVYFLYKVATDTSVVMTSDLTTVLLYIGSAPITLLPLYFFSVALKHAKMSMIGLIQYIEPSLQFLLAVIIFGEVFDNVKLVSFTLIWFGLAISILERLHFLRPKPRLPQA